MTLFARTNKTATLEAGVKKIVENTTVNVHTAPDTNNIIVSIHYSDYLYHGLKDVLTKIRDLVVSLKIKNVVVELVLEQAAVLTVPMNDTVDPLVVVDLLEVLKTRVPSAQNVGISLPLISFQITDYGLAPQVALNLATSLVQHFSEDLPDGVNIHINLGGRFIVKYGFQWLKTSNINETIVNSNRYTEVIRFLVDNPHPGVETFIFQFRDANKGFYSELNIVPPAGATGDDYFNTVEYVRQKLKEKFPTLPLF